jgi:peroxiredoxin
MRWRTIGWGAGIGVLTIAVAYVVGVQAGNLINRYRRGDYRSRRDAQTKQILEKMGTIHVGDTLPDFALEDLEGHIWRLSELVRGPTLITFFKPDCGACEVQIQEMKRVLKTDADWRRIVLISSANPLHLKRFVQDRELKCVVLYDEDRIVTQALKVFATPMTISANKTKGIDSIIVGVMYQDEINAILALNDQ